MKTGTEKDQAAPPARKVERWLQFVPNSLTLCNSLCGYIAILVTLQAYTFGIYCWPIPLKWILPLQLSGNM